VAERLGNPEALGRVATNRDVLARIAAHAIPARKADAWNPGGWVMRTHPDFTEVIEREAPADLQVVYGMSVLVDSAGRIYAVGWGMSRLWVRSSRGPGFDEAVASGAAFAGDGLPDWIAVDAWKVDRGERIRASAELTRELATTDA
jgi:hypothetical protein